MPQLFRPHANGIARFVLWGGVAAVALAVVTSSLVLRSNVVTGADRRITQPVPFSHAHHVGGLGLDCRFCHQGAEVSAFAGLPSTKTCMTCHSQIWADAPMLAPVRASLASGEPLQWKRVNDLPDFVFFNHAIHVNKGVACVTCHGDASEMPLMRQAESLTMSWCLDCHTDPQPNLRPPEQVFSTDWQPPENVEELRRSLMRVLDIHPENMTDCYVCHR